MRRVITAIAGLIPNRAKVTLRGSPSKPSWTAAFDLFDFVLILSRMVGSKGRVVAFEPIPSNFRVLSDNIRNQAASLIAEELGELHVRT